MWSDWKRFRLPLAALSVYTRPMRAGRSAILNMYFPFIVLLFSLLFPFSGNVLHAPCIFPRNPSSPGPFVAHTSLLMNFVSVIIRLCFQPLIPKTYYIIIIVFPYSSVIARHDGMMT